MLKYKILLWDLDDTIFDFKKCEHDAIVSSFRLFNQTISDESIALYSKINEGYWKRLERQEISREEVLVGRFCALFEALHKTDLNPAAFQGVYHTELGKQAFLLDGAEEVLGACKDMGYLNYAVTNGIGETQTNRIRKAQLEPFFEDVFISEIIGAEKPSRQFFDAVFTQIELRNGEKVNRKESLLIGDSLTSDMLGVKNAGIDTAWMNIRKRENNLNLRVTYELPALPDLLAILA